MTYDYKRNCATTLFAALETLGGKDRRRMPSPKQSPGVAEIPAPAQRRVPGNASGNVLRPTRIRFGLVNHRPSYLLHSNLITVSRPYS